MTNSIAYNVADHAYVSFLYYIFGSKKVKRKKE